MRLDLSISELCRQAHVPRTWFERAKEYNKALDYIDRLQTVLNDKENGNNNNTGKQKAD